MNEARTNLPRPMAVALFASTLFSSVACNMAGKSPYGNLGGAGGSGNGGTSTGNAVARHLDMESYEPSFLPSGGAHRISITVLKVRARIDGTWYERNLNRSYQLQPAGVMVAKIADLMFPNGTYSEVTLSLTGVSVEALSISGTVLQPLIMRFVGSTLEQGAGVGLNAQDYVDNLSAASTNAQLLTAWNNSIGELGPRGTGPHHHVLFVASNPNNGVGIEGLDLSCQQTADTAALNGNLPSGRTWKALLSTSSENARDRISILGKVFNSDSAGSQLISSASNFWDPNISWRASQNFSASGGSITTIPVWTGSLSDGTYLADGTCDDWHSNNSGIFGGVGASGMVDSMRIFTTTQSCFAFAGIYCLNE